jgi:signal transduction histidine kinase
VSWVVVGALGWLGWALFAAAALAMRRRVALVADAEHELRGAATAIGLAVEPQPLVQLQVDRMTAALADLARARGAPAPAPANLAAGRLAQVLGNVSANAAEHGVGPVPVRSERIGEVARIEVSNQGMAGSDLRPAAAGRGRGLRIAKRAARELGGRVTLERVDGVTRAVIELPAGEAQGERSDDPRRAA